MMLPMTISLRRARLSDVLRLSRLLALTWRKTFSGLLSPRALREVSRRWHSGKHLAWQVRDRECYFGVAADARGRILGLTTVRRTGKSCAFMLRLYVRPGCQGGGLGERLLSAGWDAFPGLRRMRLEVLAGNRRAIAFYRKHGFRRVGRRKEPLGEEALDLAVMEKRRG
jgi:ribosomal protein S18 acetylase RimI-like enzyme